MGGRGGGNNNLFEPFYDSLRIAGPIMMQQKQLDAQKQRADQAFLMQKQKLLQEAEQAQRDVEIKTTLEMFKNTMESVKPEDPESVFRARAVASQLEKSIGKPVFPRDEMNELILPGMTWAKPTKPQEQYDIKDTDQGLMFIPKDPNSGLQAKPTGFNAPLKKWEAQPAEPPSEKSPIIDRVDKGDHVLLFMRDGTTRREDKNLPPQKGEQGTKPPKDHVFDVESNTMKLIEGSPTHIKQRNQYSQDSYRLDAITSKLGMLEKSAEKLASHPGINNITGLIGANTWDISDNARNARAKLEEIGSKVAIQAISEMREASKTGGALGNTSDADILLLKSSIASLKAAQSKEQMIEALNEIRDVAAASKARMKRAYDTAWGDWDERTSKKPISTKNLDITTVPADELKKQLGITQ